MNHAIEGYGCIDALSEFLDEFYPGGPSERQRMIGEEPGLKGVAFQDAYVGPSGSTFPGGGGWTSQPGPTTLVGFWKDLISPPTWNSRSQSSWGAARLPSAARFSPRPSRWGGCGSRSRLATIQELSDFALPYGVTQDLSWSAASFREADCSFPIHCVRPAPMMRTGALREVLVCCRDHFAVDPARRGFAPGSTSANPLPSLNSSR